VAEVGLYGRRRDEFDVEGSSAGPAPAKVVGKQPAEPVRGSVATSRVGSAYPYATLGAVQRGAG